MDRQIEDFGIIREVSIECPYEINSVIRLIEPHAAAHTGHVDCPLEFLAGDTWRIFLDVTESFLAFAVICERRTQE